MRSVAALLGRRDSLRPGIGLGASLREPAQLGTKNLDLSFTHEVREDEKSFPIEPLDLVGRERHNLDLIPCRLPVSINPVVSAGVLW